MCICCCDRHAHRPLLVPFPGQVHLPQRHGSPGDSAGQDLPGSGHHGTCRHLTLLHLHGHAGRSISLPGGRRHEGEIQAHIDGKLCAVAGCQPHQLCLCATFTAHPVLQRRVYLLGVIPLQHGQQEDAQRTHAAGPSTRPKRAMRIPHKQRTVAGVYTCRAAEEAATAGTSSVCWCGIGSCRGAWLRWRGAQGLLSCIAAPRIFVLLMLGWRGVLGRKIMQGCVLIWW